MTADDPIVEPRNALHDADYARAQAYLRRATWGIIIVLIGVGASLWVAQRARGRGATSIVHNREIARAATAAEAALDIFPAAVIRARVDTLAKVIDEDPTDQASAERLVGIQAALDSSGVDSVRARIERLVRFEDEAFQGRAESQQKLRRVSGVILIVSVLALLTVVLQMRRRLSDQLDRVLESHRVIESQNEQLRAKRDALAEQTEQLRSAATEMEVQAAELEEQTLELEATIEELRETERLHRATADESALLSRRLAEAQRVAELGYWEIDSATGEVFWSEEMYVLAGLDPHIKPPPTDRFIAAVHPDDRQRMMDVATRAVEMLTEFNEQYRLPAADRTSGMWRTVQARGRIVDGGGTRKLVGTVQDITERAQLETQLRRSQKMEAVGQLAGGVAHDFNNILTVIEGYSSLLLSGCAHDDPAREDVEEIRRASARAAALTRQLLAFSRQQVLQPRVLDINGAITTVEKMLRRLIGEHIEFAFELDPEVGPVKADPGQLEQVIVNLVVNARDAMSSGGRLSIRTANAVLEAAHAPELAASTVPLVPGPHVMLAIMDTGTGIAPDHMEHIFEPFFTTKESGKGTGLGLSTVHGIIEQSGGHIRVVSELERGTSFELYFPPAPVEQPAASNVVHQGSSGGGSERILLVEDDPAVRTVAGAALRRAGYAVITADNGLEALHMCEDPAFAADLVVTDMVMPSMGGRELSEHLRDIRPQTPILFMSGYTRDTGVYNSGLAAGESFIEKPFTPEALTQKVRDALDRNSTSA